MKSDLFFRFCMIFLLFLLTHDSTRSIGISPFSSRRSPPASPRPAVPYENFIETTQLPDGETVIRLKFNNVTAMQSSISHFNVLQTLDENEEIPTLFQFWTVKGDIEDCAFSNEPNGVRDFMDQFYGKDSCPNNNTCNGMKDRVTRMIEDFSDLPPEFAIINRNEILVEKCTQFHNRLQYRGDPSNENDDLNQLIPDIPAPRRKKREIQISNGGGLLFPGTNWCGSGYSSRSFNELGFHASADRCCRDHDHCRYTIAPFTWKYNLFNYRFHTVSHCNCDDKFRACLKYSNTLASNMIGKLFFNLGRTKCFVFKREHMCKMRNWWGQCVRQKRSKVAYFRTGKWF